MINTKKMAKVGLIIVAMVLLITTLVACNVPNNLQGKYKYSSSSYIQVDASTCDYENVYVGDVYYENGTYAGSLTFSGSGLKFEATERKGSKNVFDVVAKKKYNNGTVTIKSTLYGNETTKKISLAGREYLR